MRQNQKTHLLSQRLYGANMMEHQDFEKLAEGSTEALKEALEGVPFVIVVKSLEVTEPPDIVITIKAADPCDVIVLAARIIALYKNQFRDDPIIEIQP